MAQVYKRLGAIAASGTMGTADILSTCPAGTQAVVSTITVCNTAATAATFRIAINTTSSFPVTAGYLVYGATVPANDTVTLTLGVTMDATNNRLLVSASANTVAVSAFGVEIS